MVDAKIGTRELAERILTGAVSDLVSEKLGAVGLKLNDHIKDRIPLEDQPAARIMLLQMIREGCQNFCDKMEYRIQHSNKKA